MLSIVFGMSLSGIEGKLINVEVDINNGLPSWEIVGLPDASVRESKERVRTAIKNSGFDLQSRPPGPPPRMKLSSRSSS